MNIIFLDIDGCLNTHEGQLTPELVSIFKELVRKSGAEVVLSSSWRAHESGRNFIKENVVEFKDCTPIVLVQGMDHTETRGLEIQAWLSMHPETEKYAILDDNGHPLPSQEGNYFKTHQDIGLTEEIAERIAAHLA